MPDTQVTGEAVFGEHPHTLYERRLEAKRWIWFILHVTPHTLDRRTERPQRVEVRARRGAVLERGRGDDPQETRLSLGKCHRIGRFEQGKCWRHTHLDVHHARNR